MGYDALPPTHSNLSFKAIHLFERVLEPRGINTQVSYREPTLCHILFLFSFNFKLTFYNFELTCFKACRPGYFVKSECEIIWIDLLTFILKQAKCDKTLCIYFTLLRDLSRDAPLLMEVFHGLCKLFLGVLWWNSLARWCLDLLVKH